MSNGFLDLSSVVSSTSASLAVQPPIIETPRFRQFQNFRAMVTINEDHSDDLTITEHPVEFGAAITDHAFKRPTELQVRVGWSQSYGVQPAGDLGGELALQGVDVRAIYQQILDLQASRAPFDVWTGKKDYKNMLVASIRTSTDASTEWAFIADISFREILLVSTQTIPFAAQAQNLTDPSSNLAPINNGEKSVMTTGVTDKQVTDSVGADQWGPSGNLSPNGSGATVVPPGPEVWGGAFGGLG
jgi:hypothetical protein